MSGRTPLGTIDGSGPCERVQVNMRQCRGGSVIIEVVQQHYGEGIGWFNQRTMELDAHQWQQLRGLLSAPDVSERLESESSAPRDVVPFPGPSERVKPRRAVGDRDN